MSLTSGPSSPFGTRLDAMVATVMLHPGGIDAARLLLRVRYFVLAANVLFLAYVAHAWRCSPAFLPLMSGIDLAVLLLTVALSATITWLRPRSFSPLLVALLASDLVLELLGLMTSLAGHTAIFIIPLLTLLTAAVVLELRPTLALVAFFVLAYPAAAVLVHLGYWPVPSELDWRGVTVAGSPGGVVVLALAQELYLLLVLVPFLLLVAKLRALYRDFNRRLDEAVTRVQTEGQRRRELEAGLRRTQRLESLGLLAGGVAHDFNNILQSISGRAELAERTLAAGAPARSHLTGILTSARRAAELCRQMMTYAGRGSPRKEPVDLNALLAEMPALVSAALPPRAHLVYELAPALPAVEGDASQLRQVTMNLIINAGEAVGAAGGTVTVTSGRGAPPAAAPDGPAPDGPAPLQLEIGTPPAGDAVWVRVRDTGCGMDQATLERMFDPFFTTKFTGRGLGLAAVAGIVAAHRGAIRVVTAPDRGTAVTVAFTACAAAAVAAVAAPATAWRGHGTVLVIDDEEAVLDVVGDMLAQLGFRVLTAASGAAGLELYRRHADEIILVVCDYAMPRMSGDEVVRALRRQRAELKVIIASGCVGGDGDRPAPPAGVEVVLQKPFSVEQLAAAARALVGDPGRASA